MISALVTLSFALITFIFFLGLTFLYFQNKKNPMFLCAALNFLCAGLFLFGEYLLQVLSDPAAIVFWTKIVYLGGFGFLFSFPMFCAAITGREVHRFLMIILLALTLGCQWLVIGTELVITSALRLQLGMLRGGNGPLYPFCIALLVIVCTYAYANVIAAYRKPVKPDTNYYPMVLGIGVCLLMGIVDVLNAYLNRPLLPGMTRPFIYGIFIMSVSFAETFFSQFSWAFTTFTRSERAIEQLIEKSNRNFLEFVQLIARTLDAKDHYTAGHSLRVMDYAIRVARALDLPERDVLVLKQACLLHDIGKIGIPDGILNKKSPLSERDRDYIVRHPAVGTQILGVVSDFQEVIEIIQSHHERIDGTGYPRGLARDDIPLLARILAVADTYDAICSERPYRRAKTPALAIRELRKVRDTQLDERIVDKFIEVIT